MVTLWLLETGCEGECDRCDFYWITLKGSLMRYNLHPYLLEESVDDDHDVMILLPRDSLIV